jgi:hypothetical protein
VADSDGSGEKPKNNVVDICDRLPPLIFGDSKVGRVAVRLFSVLSENEDEATPSDHIAALMITSIALQQKVLKEGWGLSEEELDIIRSDAMVLADGMRIHVRLKERGEDESF